MNVFSSMYGYHILGLSENIGAWMLSLFNTPVAPLLHQKQIPALWTMLDLMRLPSVSTSNTTGPGWPRSARTDCH